MQSCQSYQSCPVCTHKWSPGSLVGKRQCVCDGYRRFLSIQSRARQKNFTYKGHEYQYRFVIRIGKIDKSNAYTHTHTQCIAYMHTHINRRIVEERPAPKKRDDAFVRRAVGIATEKKPFLGHKSPPLLCRWPGYSWVRMNVPEIMHGQFFLTEIMHDLTCYIHTCLYRCQEFVR